MKRMMITVRMVMKKLMMNLKISLQVSVRSMQVMSKAMMRTEATLLSMTEAILGMMATTRVKKMVAKEVLTSSALMTVQGTISMLMMEVSTTTEILNHN